MGSQLPETIRDAPTSFGLLIGAKLKFMLTTGDSETEGEITFSKDARSFDGYYRDPEGRKRSLRGTTQRWVTSCVRHVESHHSHLNARDLP